MEETQIKVNDSSYQISDGHVVSRDFKKEEINYSELIINDKECNLVDRRHYDKGKRVKDIQLCVKFDNYFANLASILNFVVEAEGSEDSSLGVVLKKIEKDLAYLQENYTIVERDCKDNYPSINIF